MSLLLVAAATFMTSAWPVDGEATFDCTLERDVITHRANGDWQVTSGGTPRNTVRFRDARLTFRADGKVMIDLPEDAFNLSGEFDTSTSEGVVNWSASSPGYCGVLDSQCLATAAFYLDDDGQSVLSIYVPAFARKDGRKSFASIQYLYACARAS